MKHDDQQDQLGDPGPIDPPDDTPIGDTVAVIAIIVLVFLLKLLS